MTKKEFSGTSGFSSQNLWYMRQFYLEYREYPNLQQVVGEIPWGQNLLIISRIKDFPAREYYLRMTAEMGWSRNVLLHQIQTDAYRRHYLIKKQHNFEGTLPVALAEQADQAMKDIYALDFLGITKPVVERELERQLINLIPNVWADRFDRSNRICPSCFSYHNENLAFLKFFRYHNLREIIKMGEYEKHIRMAREKLKAVRNAFKNGQHTVVILLLRLLSSLLRLMQPWKTHILELIWKDISFRETDTLKR